MNFLLGLLLLGGMVGTTTAAVNLDAASVDRVIAIDREAHAHQADRMNAIRSAYGQLQPTYQRLMRNLSLASADELRNLWRFADFMAYSTREDGFVVNMLSLAAEHDRRGIRPDVELQQRLAERLISFRRFDDARQYAGRTGVAIEYLPPLEGAGGPPSTGSGLLRVDAEKERLTRHSLDLRAGSHVVVVSFIGCVFSRRAADAIERHETLRGLMRAHGTWIVPPGALHFNDVLAWNKAHPSTQFSYVDGAHGWDLIDDWSTPTFYFVREGRVIAKLKGWASDDAGIAALLEAMTKHGFAARSGAVSGPQE